MISSKSGNTILELLIVVAIFAISSSTVLAKINTSDILQQSRNTQRAIQAQQISTAIQEYIIDSRGELPPGFPEKGQEVEIGTGSSYYQLPGVTGKYLPSIPVDPLSPDTKRSGYSVKRDSNEVITVTAIFAENKTIQTSQ
jgi:type II secretory pathway pseudopilin PulG